MTRKEFITEKFNELNKSYVDKNMEFFANPSIGRLEPFQIADDLWYVGDKKVCIHLIRTSEGLILLDSGYLGAAHLLVDSIWRAGFDPKDVRWIIHTHGHNDHFGASSEFKNMYGTKLAISRADAESLRKKPHRANVRKYLYPMAEIPEFDYEIEDGEVFEFGGAKLRCMLTPGHTEGVLSIFFDVTFEGNTYLAGMFGGAGVNAVRLPYLYRNENPMNTPQIMLSSIEKLMQEKVEVHLGNHPANNNTLEKRERQLSGEKNPFIDPDSWCNFLTGLKATVEKIIKENEEMEKLMSELPEE